MIVKWVKRALILLVLIGVYRGVVRYNEQDHGSAAKRAGNAIIGASDDITYRYFGEAMDWLTRGANHAPAVVNTTVGVVTSPGPTSTASPHK